MKFKAKKGIVVYYGQTQKSFQSLIQVNSAQKVLRKVRYQEKENYKMHKLRKTEPAPKLPIQPLPLFPLRAPLLLFPKEVKMGCFHETTTKRVTIK